MHLERIAMSRCKKSTENKGLFTSKTVAVHIDTFEKLWHENPYYLGCLLQSGFTEAERNYAKTFKSFQHFAVRLACKLAASHISRIPWYHFEVIRSEEGVPHLKILAQHIGHDHKTMYYEGVNSTPREFLISLTHDDPWAIAYVSTYSPSHTL